MAIDDGGPAFPCDQDAVEGTGGMTLRDWFAGQAMNGALSNPDLAEMPLSGLALWAYDAADAMLEERKS